MSDDNRATPKPLDGDAVEIIDDLSNCAAILDTEGYLYPVNVIRRAIKFLARSTQKEATIDEILSAWSPSISGVQIVPNVAHAIERLAKAGLRIVKDGAA